MSDNISPEVDGEEEWATVGATIKPRRLAPQTNLVKPEFIATPSAVTTHEKDNKEDETSKKAMIRFTRDELVKLRPSSSKLLACMEDIADIISVDAIEPEVSSPYLLYTTNTLLAIIMVMVVVMVMIMVMVVLSLILCFCIFSYAYHSPHPFIHLPLYISSSFPFLFHLHHNFFWFVLFSFAMPCYDKHTGMPAMGLG